MLLRFTKMHGLGNDFMVVDGVTQKIFFSPELIVGNAATPFMSDVSFIVLPFVIVITHVCCQRLTLSVCKVTLVISDS